MKIKKTIRDSVHGDILIEDDLFIKLINTPEFQRLRRIAQLGGAQFAFPSATHTRFSHSLGVYYVISQFLKNSYFEKSTTKEEKTLVLIAGLLHDIGHGAYSHTFEKITNRSHEEYSRDIIMNPNGNIAKILKSRKIDPKDVASIIEGTYPNKTINLLVSSQLDADRLDYLARDSYNAGVDYASLETSWLINHLEIQDNRIVFPNKAIYAIESYLLGRYHMFKQVYNHKLSISFDVVFQMWFKRLKDLVKSGHNIKSERILYFFKDIIQEKQLPLDKYIELDDFSMSEIFKLSKFEDDKILNDLADRILNRRFFQVEKTENVDEKTITKELTNNGYDLNYYFAEIQPKQITIYKDGIIDGKDETIYIDDNGNIVPFSKKSTFKNTTKDTKNKKNTKVFLFPKY